MNSFNSFRPVAHFLRTIFLLGLASTLPAAGMALDFESDGTTLLENSLVRLRVTNRPGREEGIRGWEFKPTGYEMVDVLFWQLDAGGGHLLGLLWDATDIGDVPGGRPEYGNLFVPRVARVSDDGRVLVLRQTTQGHYLLTRTLILRRDHAVVEARFELENREAAPSGFALRLHNVQSPGARGQYASRHDRIDMVAEAGPLNWRQDLPLDVFLERYGATVAMFPGFRDEPRNIWTRRAPDVVSALSRPFAVHLNPENGDGMVFIGDPRTLLGFYNAPGITLEPVFRPITLRRGETWSTRVYIGAFGGLGEGAIAGATPLYVATDPPGVAGGRLRGTLSPLFTGLLRIETANGDSRVEYRAAALEPIELDLPCGADWQMVALDRRGREIGRTGADGVTTLFEPEIVEPERQRPPVEGPLFSVPEQDAEIRAMIAARDFVIQCDHTASERVAELARQAAGHLGVGLARTPRYRGRMIAFGSSQRSATMRNIGLLKRSIDADWPGADRGAILYYDNFEATGAPVVAVGGSDAEGAFRAARAFFVTYIASEPAAAGFDLWVKPLSEKGMAWDRPRTSETADRILLRSARNEYECAQVMLTAYEPLSGITAELDPLRHADTGEEISTRFITSARKHHGPILLRWAQPFPLKPRDGGPGVPDGLLERAETTLDRGVSQVLWITTMVAENAEPGRYRSALRVTANGVTKRLPIELEVYDFALPRQGLQGVPYMSFNLMSSDGTAYGFLRPHHIDRMVRTLVEHRHTLIKLNETRMLWYHISPEGAYKGIKTDDLLANEDGTLLLDVSRFNQIVERAEAAARPFELDFKVGYQEVLNWYTGGLVTQFERALPDRFDHMPARKGHRMQSYWAQEMMTLFRRHLERRDMLDRVVLKIGDEPAGFDWWWKQLATAARESGLRFKTAFNSINWEQAEKGLGTNWDYINPIYQRFDPEFARRAQEQGHKVGWYNCGPPPRHSIGASPSELRSYYWQAAKYNLDFVARWGIQCWGTEGLTPENVWTYGSSNQHALYPEHPDKPPYVVEGRGWVDTSPIESIRFNLIRDGLEDAEYVRLLRRCIAGARDAGRDVEAERAEALLDALWNDLFPSLNHYNPPYDELMARRDAIARAILDLQGATMEQ